MAAGRQKEAVRVWTRSQPAVPALASGIALLPAVWERNENLDGHPGSSGPISPLTTLAAAAFSSTLINVLSSDVPNFLPLILWYSQSHHQASAHPSPSAHKTLRVVPKSRLMA